MCGELASKRTLDCSTQRETVESCTSSSSAETPILGDFIDSGFCPARQHRYCMMCLLASVLPAPETPETTIAWLPAKELEIRNEVQHLRKQMLERNISLRAAHCINGAAISNRGQFDWKHAHDQFLLSVAGLKKRRSTTCDLRIKLARVLEVLQQR